MMWMFFIILIISSIIIIVTGINNCNFTILIFGSIIFMFTIAQLFIYDSTPTAMDVYRNKTTLEITYKDSVAIDSVVVFSNKK